MSVAEVAVPQGLCLGFGGTNARVAVCEQGDITGFHAEATPETPDVFFAWMARKMLQGAHEGNAWLVAGFPGPVSRDGRTVGPMVNVQGMRQEQYSLAERLDEADPAVSRLLDEGFVLLPVNDGTLAAQAVAARFACEGGQSCDRVAALIIGTGVGTGIVDRDPNYHNVFRPDPKNPDEIGHLVLTTSSMVTLETTYSGPALQKRAKADPAELPITAEAWISEGQGIGQAMLNLGLMRGPDLVVPTGGIGAGASAKYERGLNLFIRQLHRHGNAAQKMLFPQFKLLDPAECDSFEMHGAEGVMRAHLTSVAA